MDRPTRIFSPLLKYPSPSHQRSIGNGCDNIVQLSVRRWDLLLGTAILLCSADICLADSTQTIVCPPGRVHCDTRKDAGGQEFCELLLPGSLVVKDGPFRFWFSAGHQGSEGAYKEGREVGPWQECDRFHRCHNRTYDAIFPEEQKRSTFRPEIPVSYVNGQYRFDFASCRSTRITKAGSSDPINLNINGTSPYRCEIAYIPQSVLDHGGKGDYLCEIPYSVGVRTFNSLDLVHDFPGNGLPQFCHSRYPSGEPLLVQDKHGLNLATTVDIQSEEMKTQSNVLIFKFNSYATDLLMKAIQRAGPLTTLLCFHPLAGPEILKDGDGASVFRYVLSSNRPTAQKERACANTALSSERNP